MSRIKKTLASNVFFVIIARVTESYQLYLLGGFRLEKEGNPIKLPRRKVESLLAYLALYPEAHPRETLATLLWGDSTDAQARLSLRVALNALRSTVHSELLLGDRETIGLNPSFPLWIDAREMQVYVAGEWLGDDAAGASRLLTSWGGELLAGYYDEWIEPERTRLRALYLESLLGVVARYRSLSDYPNAITFAKRVLETDRANETAHQHLIFLYAVRGDRTDALKQFEECVAALAEELGVEPSPETIALAKQIDKRPSAQSPAAAQTNLPKPLTSFVGRESEIAELCGMTETARLVTLTGAGGSGKTRLAIQVGRALLEKYKDGVWWVELAPLSDATLVAYQVANALGLQEQPHTPPLETIVNYLRTRVLCLILDNCEHLVSACAELAEILLGACESLEMLATSREALNIAGEQIYPVAPLAAPEADQNAQPTLEDALEYPAVRLFVERARLANPRFDLDDDGVRTVAHICRRLDGIPLAIELAAARVKYMSLDEITARLAQRFEVLVGTRAFVPRQQTLRALIDWSYNLLNEDERALFRGLSIFAGGWTIGTLDGVVGAEKKQEREKQGKDSTARLVGVLVDKSLITADTRASETRYAMLETIREYAHEKLEAAGETVVWSKNHLDLFLHLAEEADTHWRAGDTLWVLRLDAEADNLRAALETSFAQENIQAALRLTGALGNYWYFKGQTSEGTAKLEQALALPHSTIAPQILGKAFTATGTLAWVRGETETALRSHQSAYEFYRAADDTRGMANALYNAAGMYLFRGEYAQARQGSEQALELANTLQDARVREQILSSLGTIEQYEGNLERAEFYYQQVADSARTSRHQDALALALHNLAGLARIQSKFSEALALSTESEWLAQQIEHAPLLNMNRIETARVYFGMGKWREARHYFQQALVYAQKAQESRSMLQALGGLAACAGAEGKQRTAVRLFAAAAKLRNSTGIEWEPTEESAYGERLKTLRTDMERAPFDAAWMVGETLTGAQIVELLTEL